MPEEATAVPTALTDEQRQTRLIERITLIAALLGIISIGLYVFLYFQTGAWQILADAGLVALAVLCLAPTRRLARRQRFESAGYWMLLAVVFAYGGGTLVWSGTALYNVTGGILLIFLVATTIRSRKWGIWILAAVSYTALLVLVDRFEPLPRYDIAQSAMLRVHVPAVTGALVALTLWQVARAFRVGNIRTRLLIAFVSVVLLPVIAIGIGVATVGLPAIQQQLRNQLESVAILKEAEIDTWLEDLQLDLEVTLSGPQLLPHLGILAKGTPGSEEYRQASQQLRDHFLPTLEQTGRYDELFVMDLDGVVLVSTDATQEGGAHSSQIYFREGLQAPYIQQPFYSPATGRTSMFASHPVVDDQGAVVGVLAGRVNLERLNEILTEQSGLGETGQTYLVAADHTLLTPDRLGTVNVWVSSQGIEEALDRQASSFGLYENYRGEPVVGVYRWLPGLQVALLAEREEAEAIRPIYFALSSVGGVVLLSVLAAVGVSLFITQGIATPVAGLAETATRIAAGDLNLLARVEREDEIGALARAFNSMTTQLRESIASLERRVADRTQELERRSTYLEAAAQVGQIAASILDPDQLIGQVVDLICERFDLYYVGLFLVDQTGEWAVLRANAGRTGRLLPERGERLKIGPGSMIGWSIAHAQARVALEAAEDAERLARAELPDTRSEAALPLRSRGQVLGALTVQHTEPGAFDQAAVVVLQAAADEVAVALENARLFVERQEVLEAMQRAYGELSREAWREMLQAGPDRGYRSDEQGITDAGDAWWPEMEQALQTGQTIRSDGSDAERDAKQLLAVPIKARGEVVGVLDTYKPAAAGDWTSDEVDLLEAIADQLGEALESARLYQETQRRAAREQAIRQVTEQMRRAVDVETILQNTVTELAKALGAPRAYVRLGTEAELRPGGGQGQPADSHESSRTGEGGQDDG